MIFSSPLYGPDPGTSSPVHHRTMKDAIDLHVDRLGWLTYMIKIIVGDISASQKRTNRRKNDSARQHSG